jgi:hypothetical protein
VENFATSFPSVVIQAANFATSFASVVDTGGKFAAGVNDNNGYNIRLLRP